MRVAGRIAGACLLVAELSAMTRGAELEPLRSFFETKPGLEIVSRSVPRMPWTVAGEHGALFGRQNGHFEAWQWPLKILSNFSIRAELENYAVPIDVNALAAEIKVRPAETVITYSHAAFTIRQHMFATKGPAPAVGAIVVFEIDSVRPLGITFSFTPEMLRMWPAPNFGRPNGEWIAQGKSGFYVLHTDNPDVSAVVAMPRSQPGIMVPYQEHPQTYPLELKLGFDPAKDKGIVFPLIVAATTATAKPAEQVSTIAAAITGLYRATEEYYAHFFDKRLTAQTPDRRVDEALRWAEIAIDQAQVDYHGETGLVAGYYESADSARPGYAWFFGRDTLWTTYAVNSYGDFALTRRALDFLIRRQRADGKIMHEFSQSAEAIDWKATPYFYASADSSQLLVMAMWDYLKTSGDLEYVKRNWEAVRKAYAFTRAHESGNGIYDNSQGTGWVESWPTGMPHQEVYLAALDQQSAKAMSRLAGAVGDTEMAASAEKKATAIAKSVEGDFYDPAAQFYAFSHNEDGSRDGTASIYPAVSSWDGGFALQKAGPMLSRWASSEFSSDWGTRDISNRTSFYDPISYHQGSIWPLFTGWVSLAEYRAGRTLSGYAHLMQNANLTWAQDLGSVTELLSGDLYQPLGRSSSHQLWSSAMVVSPLLRGLFGLDWDARNRTLRVKPALPADWEQADLRNVPLGEGRIDLEYRRRGGQMVITARTQAPESFCVVEGTAPSNVCALPPAASHVVSVALPPVELSIPVKAPGDGARTCQLKVTSQETGARDASFVLEAPGGSTHDLAVRLNRAAVQVRGGSLVRDKLHLEFPAGDGYQQRTVTFTW